MVEDGMKLNRYENNITSQNGEDGIIQYIIEHVSSLPKVCVEFGASDGKFLSNTYTLWHDSDWEGILIEADKEKFEALKRSYSKYNITAINKHITPKGENSIDSLFKKYKIDPNVGLMSIDIDSNDYYVLKYMEYVNPSIIIVEHNPTIPAYVEYHDPEDAMFLLCSAKSLEKLGRRKGYRLICCTLCNCIFIKNEIFNYKFFPDMPVEYLFDYSCCSSLQLSTFQGVSYVQSPAFYGKPKKIQIIYSKIRNIIDPALYFYRKKRKKPSLKIRKNCEKFGIYIY